MRKVAQKKKTCIDCGRKIHPGDAYYVEFVEDIMFEFCEFCGE